MGRRLLSGFALLALAGARPALAADRTPAAEASAPVVTESEGARIDWTAGEIEATGAAAADLHAPNVTIARVGAERRARERAGKVLLEAARALRLASGGTLGAAMAKDDALAARVERSLERPRDVRIDHASDGSARVTVAAPLEGLRAARVAARKGAADDDGDAIAVTAAPAPPLTAPTALLIEAKGELVQPVLGLTLRAGKLRHAGPVLFFHDAELAARDARLGARVVRGRATRNDDGELHVAGDAAEALAAARVAASPIVIVLGPPAKPAGRKESKR
jgi:hypothetical protein